VDQHNEITFSDKFNSAVTLCMNVSVVRRYLVPQYWNRTTHTLGRTELPHPRKLELKKKPELAKIWFDIASFTLLPGFKKHNDEETQ